MKNDKNLEHEVFVLALDAGFNMQTADSIADKCKGKKFDDFKTHDEILRFSHNLCLGNLVFQNKIALKIIKNNSKLNSELSILLKKASRKPRQNR